MIGCSEVLSYIRSEVFTNWLLIVLSCWKEQVEWSCHSLCPFCSVEMCRRISCSTQSSIFHYLMPNKLSTALARLSPVQNLFQLLSLLHILVPPCKNLVNCTLLTPVLLSTHIHTRIMSKKMHFVASTKCGAEQTFRSFICHFCP